MLFTSTARRTPNSRSLATRLTLAVLLLSTPALRPALAPASQASPPSARDASAAPQHPFILWTPAEAAALKRTYDAQPWVARKLAELAADRRSEPLINLYRYQVLGDEKAGERERKYLLSFINAPLDARDPSGHAISRHYDNYLHALRYDVLYHSLTPQQRAGIEATFRKFIQHELDNPYHNTRLSLLPNMQLPRMFAAHLMSVALRDEALIRELWAAPSGFRWYITEYLSDGGFYNEEFAKMWSLIGEMLLYCRGLERMGLNQLGYGLTGPDGANMRNYVESLIWIGYPRTDIPGGMPRYERVAMGDARGNTLGLFQHANVPGALPRENDQFRGFGQPAYFFASNMNGRDHRGTKTAKLDLPQWFEILHARDPQSPFAYFLYHMRPAGADQYTPTPFWGLQPITSQPQPPAAASHVWPQRGFAILRAEQSPQYWASPKPAVALQFATLYVHYTADCFSLLGYHAFNRPIYINPTISAGYKGGPWDFSVRGHCGVVVDGEQAQPIGTVPTRQDFQGPVRFVAARGVLAPGAEGYKGRGEVRSSDQPREPFTDVYSDIDLSRALFLTDEYLFDVYQLADKHNRPRDFHWLVHAPGRRVGSEGWSDSARLQATLMNVKPIPSGQQPRPRTWEHAEDPADSWIRITGEQQRAFDNQPVDLTLLQTCALDDVSQSILGEAWYDRRIGVRVRLLPEPDTIAYTFDTPTAYPAGTHRAPRDGKMPHQPETGGVSVAIHRQGPRTIFAALHEPIENAASRIDRFRRIAQTDDALAVRIQADDPKLDDRAMVRIGQQADQPITLAGQDESFTFVGHAFVRISATRVIVTGDLRAMRLRVQGNPQLVVNGQPAAARVQGSFMTYTKP